MNNSSPLRYPGGKTRACKILDQIYEKYFKQRNFKKIVSPFFGGGSFEFYMQNKYKMSIIANDLFKPLSTFWKTCKEQNAGLVDKLLEKLDQITKTEFSEFRNSIMEETDVLKQSVMYFIINRCSFSGATLSGGFSLEASKKRFTKSSITKISKLDLRDFEIYCDDFSSFLEKYGSDEDCLIFADPPYYLDNPKLYGKNGDLHENFDHKKLCLILKNIKNWILTYNDCEYIRDLYSGFEIIETSWSYGMNKSKKSSEIIIVNY